MASIEEYLKKQDTALLESLLRAYCDGREDMMPEVALCICQILALRNSQLFIVQVYVIPGQSENLSDSEPTAIADHHGNVRGSTLRETLKNTLHCSNGKITVRIRPCGNRGHLTARNFQVMGRGQAYQTAIHSVGHGLGNDTSERAEGVFGIPFIVLLLEKSLKPLPCKPTNLIRSKLRLYVDSDSLSVIQKRCFLQIVLTVVFHPIVKEISKANVR